MACLPNRQDCEVKGNNPSARWPVSPLDIGQTG